MITLTINNSYCSIAPFTRELYSGLKSVLKHKIITRDRYYYEPLITKDGTFAPGLLPRAIGWLKANHLLFSQNDLRRIPKGRHSLFVVGWSITPYPEQIQAAQACSVRHRGIVSAVTGVGKSFIAGLIIERLQVPTLVVVPSLELKRQLISTLTHLFGKDKVGEYSEGKPVAVECVYSLNPKEEIQGYDCLIIDEFHHSGAATYQELNKKAWSGIYYRFGLTATPFRSQQEDNVLLEAILSEVIYSIDYSLAVDKGYVVPVEAYYVEVPRTTLDDTEGRNWSKAYQKLVVSNKKRNNIIVSLIENLSKNDKFSLCLVKEIEHGNNIKKALEEDDVAFVFGDNDTNRIHLIEYLLGERKTLLGTTGILGEGVDTKPTEYVIIAGLGKSKTQLMQQVGRGLRKYPGKESCKVIIFQDKSHKWTKAHFAEQKKILLDEYGVEAVKIELGE